MFAPGVPDVMKEFGNTSNTMATFVVSVFVLGFAAGPPVVAPLSEMYGRNPVYHATNIGFTIFNILCARADSMGALVAYRFCAGVAGVGSVTNGGGSISDMMPPERRGAAMAIWAMGPLIGPTIGPIAGGYLIEAKGWRWVFWIITIAVGHPQLVYPDINPLSPNVYLTTLGAVWHRYCGRILCSPRNIPAFAP